MKALLITLTIGFTQPSLMADPNLVKDMAVEATVLAGKNDGDLKATTGGLIDWLYNEKGFTETLTEDEIKVIKDVAEVQCRLTAMNIAVASMESQKIKPKAQPTPKPKVEVEPVINPKHWKDNIAIYVNNVHRGNFTVYGYTDVNGYFVYDPAEQTDQVKAVLFAPQFQPQFYYFPQSVRQGSTVCGPAGCYIVQ